MISIQERLASAAPLLLDGATGTELHRRGVDTSLPLWSARALLTARDVLCEIHAEYLAAGAEILTANTFRTHRRNLAAAGMGERASSLTSLAVRIARRIAGGRAYVAGSQAPLEDCYTPALVPDDETLAREHAEMARNLAAAGVDLILVETQNTVREAVSAARSATLTGLPTFVSFVCDGTGHLLSGESLADAVQAVAPFNPAALLINCGPAPELLEPLKQLRRLAPDLPCGVYGNIGRGDPVAGWVNTDAVSPSRYADYARQWLDAGATIIGGCCGTTPAHIRQLNELLDARRYAS